MNTKAQAILPTHQEILNMIYANGGGKPATIVLHEDAGHAWLQVPIEQAKGLNIFPEISGYSYIDSENVYLEEDCDITLFLKAIGLSWAVDEPAENTQARKYFFQNVPEEYHHHSPIRNKQHFTSL